MGNEPELEELEHRIGADPANAELRYLYGAELAQRGKYDRAAIEFGTALHIAPHLHYARFQLGLLQLTMAQPDAALATWSALDGLTGEFAALALFKRGLEALIYDRFAECLDYLTRGIQTNTRNKALNADMSLIIQRVRTQQAASAAAPPATAHTELSADIRTDFSKYTDGSRAQ